MGVWTWIVGASLGFLGLVALAMASRGDGPIYWVGIVLFALCVLAIFGLIKAAFDHK